MAYQIFIQDFVQPVFAGIQDYFSDFNIVYSSSEVNDTPQENPHELFQGNKGMGRISTNKCDYEITVDEPYHDTKEEVDYIPEETEEEEIKIVSWEKAAEKVLQEGDFSEESKRMIDLANEDFF